MRLSNSEQRQFTEAAATARAEARAMQQFVQEMPSPEEIAAELPERVANALMASHRANGFWVVASEAGAKILRPYGLCDCGTNCRFLTAFGIKVRKALV